MVILTHQTALELWRRDFLWERLDTRACRAALAEGTNRLELDDVIDALRPVLISDGEDDWPSENSALHLLYPRGASRNWTLPNGIWHSWSHPLSAGSLYRVISSNRELRGRPFLVTSPEMTLLVMANNLAFPEVARLGFELCGSYRMSPAAPSGFRSNCEALATPSSLSQFCSRGGRGAHGVKAIRSASKQLAPDAASPRESAVAALLSFKRTYGGQGLPAPEMNGLLELDSAAQGICGKHHLFIDLLWRDMGVGIEYESDAFHTYVDPLKIESDKRRTNAALRMGVQLFPLTNSQLTDPYRFHSFVSAVAKAMHVRLRPLSGGQLNRESQLRRAFLAASS